MHPWLRRKQKPRESQPNKQGPKPHKPRHPIIKCLARQEQGRTTEAYHPPEKSAPRYAPNRRHVKDLLTNHWDLDSLSRVDFEIAMQANKTKR